MSIFKLMKWLVYFIVFSSWLSWGQAPKTLPKASYDEVRLMNDLVYDASGRLYTGVVQKKKKNGQLIYEDYVTNGIIDSTLQYYRSKDHDKPYAKYLYNPKKLFYYSKIVWYESTGAISQIEYYDDESKKRLLETYDHGRLTYSCEYKGKKRHGKEFCITKACDTTVVYYVDGKKQRWWVELHNARDLILHTNTNCKPSSTKILFL